MDVINSLTETQINQLHGLYQHEWWTKGRTLDDTKICVNHSQICIGLIDEQNNLLGFCRILTDYIFKAFIFDVIVRPDQRGLGLGDTLVALAKNHDQLQDVKHIELYCLPDMINFYQKHGFTTNAGGMQLMRFTNA
jgi:predicted GNAT family N-acyltransferase